MVPHQPERVLLDQTPSRFIQSEDELKPQMISVTNHPWTSLGLGEVLEWKWTGKVSLLVIC